MKKHKWTMHSIIVLLTFFHTMTWANEGSMRWAVYYTNQADINAFEPYQFLVLDSDEHIAVSSLHDRGKIVLGYISLGEVESYRHYFNEAKSQGYLLQENIYWPGSFYVDVRNTAWAKHVIEEQIPAILAQDFDGLFFDTLDNPVELERINPSLYKGMTKASVQLVKAIRENYPDITIMMNRGYEILPEVANDIDMVLGESVYADYNFETKTYDFVETELYQHQVQILQAAQKTNPALQVFTLDYWEPSDTANIKKIYQEQRKNGFHPYVATIALDEIIPEPGQNDQ